MRATKRQTEATRSYVEDQAHEQVIHLEKAASELVGPVRHDIWDVHCADSRWWVITEPVNLYSQEDFKSRDVALTFHIGLSLRVSYLHDRRVPVTSGPEALLAGSLTETPDINQDDPWFLSSSNKTLSAAPFPSGMVGRFAEAPIR